MKIILDARYLAQPNTGLARFVKRTLEVLKTTDFVNKIYLLIGPDCEQRELVDGAEEKVSCVTVQSSPYSLKQYVELPRIVRSLDHDVFFAPHYIVPPAAGDKIIITIHDFIPLKIPRYYTAAKRFTYRWLNRSALKRADQVLTPSSFSKEDIVELFNVSRDLVKVTGHTLPDTFHQHDVQADEARQYLDSKGITQPYFFYLGNFKPHKNVPAVIEAFMRYRENGGEAQLVLGGGRVEQLPVTYQNIVKRMRDIHVIDAINDDHLAILYSHCTGFIFLSMYEGFGFPILEAMAFGVPVITSKATSLPEVAGKAALIVDARNTHEIVDAMELLESDGTLRDYLIREGYKRIEFFSKERFRRNIVQSLQHFVTEPTAAL